MLRMYECNWCGLRQVKDDGSVLLKPSTDGSMRFNLIGICYECCRKRRPNGNIMHPLKKDSIGDWYRMSYSKERSKPTERMRVEPPIMWH